MGKGYINVEKTTLDRPSDHLRGMLMRREVRPKPSTNITNTSTPMQRNILNHFNINISDLFTFMRHFQNPGNNSPSSISAKIRPAVQNLSRIKIVKQKSYNISWIIHYMWMVTDPL
jgi:hypothetical protein